jgi:DNA polymerase-3 subunit epsilon
MREIVLDTETTGLDPYQGHRIIEIGALEVFNKIPTGKVFHYYINPERNVPFEAFQVHGISTEYLMDKPKFIEIADEFIEFISDSKLVIHNAGFDMNFLNYELNNIKKPTINISQAIDTLAIARKKFPGQKNNLDALCKRFNINNSHRKYHGALKDASLLVDVYIELSGGRQRKIDIPDQIHSASNKKEFSNFNKANLNLKVVNPTEEELHLHNLLKSKLT